MIKELDEFYNVAFDLAVQLDDDQNRNFFDHWKQMTFDLKYLGRSIIMHISCAPKAWKLSIASLEISVDWYDLPRFAMLSHPFRTEFDFSRFLGLLRYFICSCHSKAGAWLVHRATY
jgi:hypothetical protein